MTVLWKTRSNIWRSITLVIHTDNWGKATPSQSGWQHVLEEAGGLLSRCGPTTPMQREWRVSGGSCLSCSLGTVVSRLLCWHTNFYQADYFFSSLPPTLSQHSSYPSKQSWTHHRRINIEDLVWIYFLEMLPPAVFAVQSASHNHCPAELSLLSNSPTGLQFS